MFDKNTIVDYLKETKKERLAWLFKEADRIRQKYAGVEVYLRGIIEFSNYCCQDCHYCGLRRSNSRVERYRMQPEDIIAVAKKAVGLNIGTVVLQSGEDPFFSLKDLSFVIKEIKKLGVAVTLSIGERSYDDYRLLKEAGADRYLLRFETSDDKLYKKLRPGRRLAQRLECLKWLKKLKYQVGSGSMIGLAGQTSESIAEDILLFDSLGLDMVGVGPFLPHPETPLSKSKKTSLETVLKVLALTRIVTKDTHIPATTAVGTIDSQGRQKALACGANVIMPNITPVEYRNLYQIYPDKICINESASKCRSCVEAIVRSAGRKVGRGQGHTLKRGCWK